MAAPTLDGLLESINRFLCTLRDLPRGETVRSATTKFVRGLCLVHNISVCEDNIPGTANSPFRICLKAVNGADFSKPLVQQSNGIIIAVTMLQTAAPADTTPSAADAAAAPAEAPNRSARRKAAATEAKPAGSKPARQWRARVVVRPANEFSEKYKPETVREALAAGLYDVYTIADGTVTTLYHYEGRWCMSTRHCCEIDANIWRGYKYREILDNALLRYPDFSWAALNPEHTYTIGFCHPAFHPFGQPADFNEVEQLRSPPHQWKVAAWIVTSSDPDAAARGLPPQPKSDVHDYARIVEANSRALDAYLADNQVQHFGYILRSRSSTLTGGSSDILMPSKLFSAIRSTIYSMDARLSPSQSATFREYYRDLNFVLIYAYIQAPTRGYLKQLFPQFADRVQKIGMRIAQVARMICEPEYRKRPGVPTDIYDRVSGPILAQYTPVATTAASVSATPPPLSPLASAAATLPPTPSEQTASGTAKPQGAVDTAKPDTSSATAPGGAADRTIVVNLLCTLTYADVYYECMFREAAQPVFKYPPIRLGDYIRKPAAGDAPIISQKPQPMGKPIGTTGYAHAAGQQKKPTAVSKVTASKYAKKQ